MKNGDRIERAIKAMRWTLTDGSTSPLEVPAVTPLNWHEEWATDKATAALIARLVPAPDGVNSLYQTKCFIAYVVVHCELGTTYLPGKPFDSYVFHPDGGPVRFAKEIATKLDVWERVCMDCVGLEMYFELVQSLLFECALPTV